MTIVYSSGDLLKQHDVDAIVNTVNCVGVMGKGIALQFKKKWSSNFKAYAEACKNKEVVLGKVFIHDLGGLATPHLIINFPTKDHWKSRSKLVDIELGLADLIQQIKDLNIHSIAMPPLGCGNGGLNWSEVKPVIEKYFLQIPEVELRLFEPSENASPVKLEINTPTPNMTPGRAAILALLETYQSVNYGLSKLEVQKLAYFLQEAGENLQLKFVKDKFGPYADNLRHALDRMDGHYIHGVGDGVVESEITPDETQLIKAKKFLESTDVSVLERIKKVGNLIEGFQSPFGMELLASVHWVAKYENAKNKDDAFDKVQEWNVRKRHIMSANHVRSAWKKLTESNWI